MHVARPRVAVIGLDQTQVESIRPLCGELRTSSTWAKYIEQFSPTETDVAVISGPSGRLEGGSVHTLAIAPRYFEVPQHRSELAGGRAYLIFRVDASNTEREVRVAEGCPSAYEALAAELAKSLSNCDVASPTIGRHGNQDPPLTPLIVSTSDQPIAIRRTVPWLRDPANGFSIVLALPTVTNLAAWFRAFLLDIHGRDPERVPAPPPAFTHPSDWYTPTQRRLVASISEIDTQIEELMARRQRLEERLADEGEHAERGVGRVLRLDGDGLVEAVARVLDDLGFSVRNMDAETEPGEPKREDLRLTLTDSPRWEAIVEVKGYTSGTRTNDSRQVREHRERYLKEEQRLPDQTLWIGNPYRDTDPSTRQPPDANVADAAANVGAVYALTTDLYRLWVASAENHPSSRPSIQSLIEAEPGLWRLPQELRPMQ